MLIVHQAQQISTPDMTRLLQHVERAGSKLLLAGDPDALQAVGRGAPFISFAQRFPAAKLTEPVRPEDPKDVANVQRARYGKSQEILQDLAARGRLHVAKSRDAAVQRLIADWHQTGGADQPQHHQILAPDRATSPRPMSERGLERRPLGRLSAARVKPQAISAYGTTTLWTQQSSDATGR